MKKPVLFLAAFALISACSSAPQVTTTPEATAATLQTMTDTPVPLPTMTETPLETPHIEDFIKITSSFPIEIEGSEKTPRIVGACNVDEALCFGCEINMPKALAEEILGGYAARFMHRFGVEGHEGQPNEAEMAAALEKIAQAQRGEIPATDAVMTIPAYLLSQGLEGEYSEVKIVFRMGTEMEVPEGVVAIDSLSTLDLMGYDNKGEVGPIPVRKGIPGFVQTYISGWGFGTVVDEAGNDLIMMGSPYYLFSQRLASLELATTNILRGRWIVEYDGKNRPKLRTNNALFKQAQEEYINHGFEVIK